MENEKTTVMLLKTNDGREANLTEFLDVHPAFIIGTDSRSALCLMGLDIQPSHAVITRHDTQYFIAPRVPTAKVSLNGRSVTMPTPINAGDTLQIGAVSLTVAKSETEAVSPIVPAIRPAVTKGQYFGETNNAAPNSIVSAAPAAIRPLDQPPQIYFPKSEAGRGLNIRLISSFLVLLVIVIIVGYALVTGSPTAAAQITSQYAYKDGHVTLVLLETSWCQVCKQQEPILELVAGEYNGKVFNQFLDAEAFANSTMVQALKVDSYPTTVIFNDQGQVVAKFLGITDAAAVRAAINQALTESVG
jgi:thiol-disulfide isomerase/thioredoxin